MKVDVAKLRGKIVEKGFTQEQVAKTLPVDKSTFSRKMTNGAGDFSITEMHGIVDCLSLTREEAKEIFLFENSHNCENEAS